MRLLNKMSLKTWLVNLSVVLASLLIAFVAGEIIIRALFSDRTTLYPRFHSSYRYGNYTIRGMRPNSVFRHTSTDGSWEFRTNSRGFRNTEEFSYEKPDSILRVLCIGDSQTQGYECRQDYTFSAVLERYLTSRGRRAQVINAGLSGWSTEEELVFLQEEGVRYHPDFVVLGFYANDLADNLRADLFNLGASDTLLARSFAYVPGVRVQDVVLGFPVTRYLSEHSYFYSLLFNATWDYYKTRALGEAVKQTATEYAIVTNEEITDYQIRLELALVRRMNEACRACGARLIILDTPKPRLPHSFTPSIPPALRNGIRQAGVDLILSTDVLSNLDGAAEFHVAHGHHHISELTHTLFGAALGQCILAQQITIPQDR